MVGDRIRNLRLVKKMTQGQLIDGIASITYLSKVENNQAQPTDQFIQRIADRLQIDPSILLGQDPNGTGQKLEAIYDHLWKHGMISDQDLALLHVQVNEAHDNRSYVMIFTTLIRYYYIDFHLQEAQKLFQQSTHFINTYDPSIEDRLYFQYFLLCGKLLMDLYMLPQADEYFLRCESYRLGAEDQDLAKYYFSLSIVKQQINKDQLVSLYYSERSLDYQKKIGDSNRLAIVLFARAIQFQLANQPKDAMNCLSEAKACFWDRNNLKLRAIFEYSIGRVYQVGKNYDQAIYYYMNALSLYKNSSFVEKSTLVHKRLVEIYIEQKNWTLVEEHLHHAQVHAKRNKEYYYDIELDILQASVYKLLAQGSQYEKMMRKIIEHCRERSLNYYIKHLGTELGNYFYSVGAYKKAATYYHQACEA